MLLTVPRASLLVALALALLASPAAAQLAADTEITGLERQGAFVQLTGPFQRIGTPTGPAFGLDAATGGVGPFRTGLGRQVSDAVEDGAGGWYTGGEDGLRRLRPDGTPDPTFAPQLVDGAFVAAIARDGDRLYVAGQSLSVVSDLARRSATVIALDATTGQVLAASTFGGELGRELVVVPATAEAPARVVVAVQNRGLRVLTRDLDTADDWQAAGRDVQALATDGRTVWAGSSRITALDAVTGQPRPEFTSPPANVARDVLLLEDDGSTLYAGGEGEVRALDPATGATRWRAAIAGFSYDLARVGDRLVSGGGLGLRRLAPGVLRVLDPATGAARVLGDAPPDGPVFALARSGDALLAGGDLSQARSFARPGRARMSVATGRLVSSLGPPAADRVVDGVRFSVRVPETDGGSERFDTLLRRVDRAGRRVRGFREVRLTDDTDQLAAGLGRLYVVRSGAVRTRFSFSRGRLVAYDLRTGRRVVDRPLPFRGYVTDAQVAGGRLYVSGSFRRFRTSGSPAHLAVLALRPDGRFDPSFDPHADAEVDGLAFDGTKLVLGGYFTRVGGALRPGLAAVRPAGGGVVRSFTGRRPRAYEADLTPLPGSDLLLDVRFPLGSGNTARPVTRAGRVLGPELYGPRGVPPVASLGGRRLAVVRCVEDYPVRRCQVVTEVAR